MVQAARAFAPRQFGKSQLLRSAAIGLFLGVAGLTTGLPALAQGYSFSQVTIEGNQNVDSATILKLAGISRGETLSAGGLNDAYQNLQTSGLFEEVAIAPQGNRLVITVKEYPIINAINFEGNARLKDELLAEAIQSKARRVYSPALAEADAASIAEGYREQGRLAATVTPKVIRRSGNAVDLVFEITEGKNVEVERLSFVGNRAFTDRRLRQVLETKQAGLLRNLIKKDTMRPEQLELDKQLLRDFYLSRGYVDVQVLDAAAEVARERDGVFVTFTLKEGQQFRFGTISAVSEIDGLDAAEFEAALKLRPGTVYSPQDVETNITRLENLALKKGLNFVSIEPVITRNERDRLLDIAFTLKRGPKVFVERIDIEGNTTTLDQVVRRQFRTVEGDPFNAREVRQSAERIRALGYFSDAQVNSRQGSSEQQVIVDVNVEEQPTGSLTLGASYGVNSGVGVNISLNETNFLGRGQTVGVTLSTADGDRAGVLNFVEPFFLGRDLRFGFNAAYHETENWNSDYDTRSIAVRSFLDFPVSQNGRLELRYRIAEEKLHNVDTDSSKILQDEQGTRLSSALGYSYRYDSRITGLNPLTGYKLQFAQDFAGLGGDVKTVTTTLLAGLESNAWREEVTLRAEFEAGAVHSYGDYSTWLLDRFRAGSKIRGFEPNGVGPRDLYATNKDGLGGNYFWAVRAEAQFPVGLPEEYGITIWGLDNRQGAVGAAQPGGIVDDGMNVRAAVGASIFWTTPIGPLRFNFSKAIRKEDYDLDQNFDLTISTRF